MKSRTHRTRSQRKLGHSAKKNELECHHYDEAEDCTTMCELCSLLSGVGEVDAERTPVSNAPQLHMTDAIRRETPPGTCYSDDDAEMYDVFVGDASPSRSSDIADLVAARSLADLDDPEPMTVSTFSAASDATHTKTDDGTRPSHSLEDEIIEPPIPISTPPHSAMVNKITTSPTLSSGYINPTTPPREARSPAPSPPSFGTKLAESTPNTPDSATVATLDTVTTARTLSMGHVEPITPPPEVGIRLFTDIYQYVDVDQLRAVESDRKLSGTDAEAGGSRDVAMSNKDEKLPEIQGRAHLRIMQMQAHLDKMQGQARLNGALKGTPLEEIRRRKRAHV
jgi:hypothetical protein